MSELNFFAFCITVIALTAIAQNKDKVAEKALSALTHTVGDFVIILEKVLVNFKNKKPSTKGKVPNEPASKK